MYVKFPDTIWVSEFTANMIAFDDGSALTKLMGIFDDCRDSWQRLLRIQGTLLARHSNL
jgi:hypothetical protein